jgi:hypothetical protein
VVLAGIGLIGFAVQQVYAAITCRLERNLDVEEMRREAGEWAVGLSRFGVAARAVVFALVGWAIVVAGWLRVPSEVGTTASSFRTLAAQPGGLGRWLLGVTAASSPTASTRSSTRAIYISDASGEDRIRELEKSEGFTRKIDDGREADFRLANRRLPAATSLSTCIALALSPERRSLAENLATERVESGPACRKH